VKILLVSPYELGHQPLAVAEPAAALRALGHEVRCTDLSVDDWDAADARWADKVAFSVPMHTAARLARELTPSIQAPVAWYGLYAAMGEDLAVALVDRDPTDAVVRWADPTGEAAARERPARDLLPSLDRYAQLIDHGELHLTGYAEASRGCAHRCKHCPVPVVYDGRIRINDVDEVVDDIAQQVAVGAKHITFGDPDFFNGVHHSLRVVRSMHERFPELTFDCTVKVEHILRHPDTWPELAASGCLFVVSAFESVNDDTLALLAKGHTATESAEAVDVLRRAGVAVRPSWLPFTPWSSIDDVRAILEFVAEHDLVANVDPIQYTIRLLVPKGSLLIDDLRRAGALGPWDSTAQSFTWASPLDSLHTELSETIAAAGDAPVGDIYNTIRVAVGLDAVPVQAREVPRLTEQWFCCAEPSASQLASVTLR
jgi:Radical SAM superfamily